MSMTRVNGYTILMLRCSSLMGPRQHFVHPRCIPPLIRLIRFPKQFYILHTLQVYGVHHYLLLYYTMLYIIYSIWYSIILHCTALCYTLYYIIYHILIILYWLQCNAVCKLNDINSNSMTSAIVATTKTIAAWKKKKKKIESQADCYCGSPWM